jgi:hypothetical protein
MFVYIVEVTFKSREKYEHCINTLIFASRANPFPLFLSEVPLQLDESDQISSHFF